MMRVAPLLLVVLGLALVAPPAVHRAAAQKRGGGRGGGPPSSTSSPRAEEPEPTAPGGYGFSGAAVQEAFQRGEGRQALAAYERAAADAERNGDSAGLARALAATTFASDRLGLYQKTVRDGTRALHLYRGQPASAERTQRMIALHGSVGQAWLAVRDLAQARQAFEDGLAFAAANARRQDRSASSAAARTAAWRCARCSGSTCTRG